MAATVPIDTIWQRSIIAIAILSVLLDLTAVSLRVWSRRIAACNLHSSDYLIFGACTAVIVFWSGEIAEVVVGAGGLTNAVALPAYGQEARETFNKWVIVTNTTWGVSCYLTKISVLCLSEKLFRPSRLMMILIWTVGAITLILGLASVIGVLASLQPISKWWTNSYTAQDIITLEKLSIFTDASTIITDFIIFAIPLPSLYKMRIGRRKKTWLMVAFLLGFTAAIVALCRVAVTYTIGTGEPRLMIGQILNGAEPTIGIIAVCIPTMRPLLGNSIVPTEESVVLPDSRSLGISSVAKTGSDNISNDADFGYAQMNCAIQRDSNWFFEEQGPNTRTDSMGNFEMELVGRQSPGGYISYHRYLHSSVV